jgi:CheY-like chemotaxis protein/predicted regulator of Ras-like GTPase activity (Roadblock/LC7/MglB family)
MAKVLVVDDSLSVRKVVERALVAKQLEVVSAASGTEAIAQIERERPDIVVCDVVMPDRDGYEICRFVKGHPQLGRTPVLLISGIVNDGVLAQAAEARSDDVLRKPFEAAELVRKVSELLAAGGGSRRAPAPRIEEPHAYGVAVAPARVAPVVVPPRPPAPAPAPAWTPPIPAIRRAPEPQPAAAAWAGARPAVAVAPAASVPLDLGSLLAQFMATSGADWASLSDREGFLIESVGDIGVEAEVAAAMAACLAESSDGIGRELGRGALGGMLIEYEKGTVLLHHVGSTAVFAVMCKDSAALGKVRYYVKKLLPDLARAI